MKSSLTERSPVKAAELETKPGWIIATVALVGIEIAAVPTGVVLVLVALGNAQ